MVITKLRIIITVWVLDQYFTCIFYFSCSIFLVPTQVIQCQQSYGWSEVPLSYGRPAGSRRHIHLHRQWDQGWGFPGVHEQCACLWRGGLSQDTRPHITVDIELYHGATILQLIHKCIGIKIRLMFKIDWCLLKFDFVHSDVSKQWWRHVKKITKSFCVASFNKNQTKNILNQQNISSHFGFFILVGSYFRFCGINNHSIQI